MKKKSSWLAALAALFIGQGVLYQGYVFPKWRQDYAPENQGLIGGLDPGQMLAAVAGFRELVAGILWVRADSFFDSGNYDAVLPLIRLVTWLDPHQLDVYATGMWHIGYNFTDEESRSDRRYLPSALALGAEGAEKNPETYEMFFETGWIWFHKIDDSYDKAVDWFEKAGERKDILPARKNLLASAYARNGEIDKSLNYFYQLLEDAELAMNDKGNYQARQIRDTIENNLDTMLVRMTQRGYFAKERSDGSFETGNYDIKPPFDVGFSVRATVEESKVIRFEGTWGVRPVGTRVRVVLKDANFPNAIPGGAEWDKGAAIKLDPDAKLTFMQDQLYVRNQRFDRKADLSKDPTMYPFTQPEYILEFYYNPRSAPAHIQDKFGFSGEGMADKLHLNSDIRKGQRVVYASFKLTRDQILRRGEWREKVPVVQTENFNPNVTIKGSESEFIVVPNLRANEGAKEPTTP